MQSQKSSEMNLVFPSINMSSESQIIPENKASAGEVKKRTVKPKDHACRKCGNCYAYAFNRNRHEQQCGLPNPLKVAKPPKKVKNLKSSTNPFVFKSNFKPLGVREGEMQIFMKKGTNLSKETVLVPLNPSCYRVVVCELHL